MVSLLKMVIFHGYVTNNQMVNHRNSGFTELNSMVDLSMANC